MQKIANEASAKHIEEYQKIFEKNWSWNKNKELLSTLINEAISNFHDIRPPY